MNRTYQKIKLLPSLQFTVRSTHALRVLRKVQGQRFTSPELIVLLFRSFKSNVKFMVRG